MNLFNGIKPRRPSGAFKIFLMEKAKQNILHSIKDGQELWRKLTDEEKNEYLKKSHKLILAYKYKKMIYNKKIKRMLPKKPPNAFFIFVNEKKGHKIQKGQKTISYWRPIYDNLPKIEKDKYEKKAKIEKEIYENKMERFKNAVFDIPKKPLYPYTMFLQDAIPKLKKIKENKNLSCSEILKKASSIWLNSMPEFRKIFEDNSANDIKRFKTEMKQFEKFGYYIKNITKESNTMNTKDLKDEDIQINDEQTVKRKIVKKRSVSIIKNYKTFKRTKSPKINNKNNSIIHKKGKTQIKKK